MSLGIYITLLIAFSLMIIGLIVSNLTFALVVKTQERKYKSASNIGWFTASLSVVIIFINCCILALGGSSTLDFCKLLDTTSN